MSLRVKIQQIAQETATQVVGAIVGQLNNNFATTGKISGFSTDSSGNVTLTVVDNNGNVVSNVAMASNRPLGVGDTVSLVGGAGSQIAQ